MPGGSSTAPTLYTTHLRDDGRAVVGNDDHLHAVLQGELKDLGGLGA